MRFATALLLVTAGLLVVTPRAQSPTPQAYTLAAEITQDGMKILVTAYRDGSKERVEMALQGAPSGRATVYDFAAHKVYWLFPGQDVTCSSGRYPSARAPIGEDPVTGSVSTLAALPKGAQRQAVRQEAVNGIAARLEEVTVPASTPWGADETRPSRVWVSEPEGMIVRVEGAKRGARPSTVYEVKQFAQGKPRAALFAVPANCVATDSEMDDSGMMRAHAEGPAVTAQATGEVNLADKKSRASVTVTERKAPAPAVGDLALQVTELPGPPPCGRKLEAKGSVAVDGPAVIWYRFYANIGGLRFSTGAEGTLTFDAAGSKDITKEITFPGARAGELKFQAAVQVRSGVHGPAKTSNAEAFRVSCGGR
jgi:hypothetical protein